uniref:ribosomal protein S2 n=1 Tax=Gayralia brasiliensis TaxID=1286870 RepID=UPI002410FB28|nr:ribosomal protein S2 [Gayralia brasiliensis]YP_010733724.1 ribosomal protein S2 [Monostroma nitidum]WEG92921.1 ribosomal protein S2 [Gayralia brasiliensis]WEG92995.1 ribosomal protein S2 [Monostroma nitidum]
MTLTLEQMVAAGMHFGHQARKWNPKMKPFIYGQRDTIHIIDLISTYTHLNQVKKFLTDSTWVGKKVLFVGTKKQIAPLIAKAALECDCFYVNEKWLGGQLTNWQTIKFSIQKLRSLQAKEQHGFLDKLPKKEAARLKKEKEKLARYLKGLEKMEKIPDIVIIVGQSEEINAVRECKKLGIPTITILDTDCDPSLADFFIPANDDSISSIKLLLNEFVEAIKKGQQNFAEKRLLSSNNKKKKAFRSRVS